MADDEHYFTADPSVAVPAGVLSRARCGGGGSTWSARPGVFSRGHLDLGTAVLFRETEPPGAGEILDLGCGYGVIGLAIAAAVPGAVVTAVDVNERAVLLANENAAALGVADRVTAATPDTVARRPRVRRDLVEPADPDRQGGAARPAAHLAAPAAARRAGGDGGRQEPGCGLAPAVAG